MSAISCSAQYFWFLLNYLVSSFNQYEQELTYWLVGFYVRAWCPNYQHIMLLSAIVYQNYFLTSARPQIKLVLIIAVLLN